MANNRSWRHSGFSVDQSMRLETGDQRVVQRLIQYFLGCPFASLAADNFGKTSAGQMANLQTAK